MRIFAMLFMLSLATLTLAQPTISDDASWVVTRRVVAPLVPKEILMTGAGSQLDARIRVGADGRLQEVLSLTSNPASPGLEAAFRSALSRWSFRIDINRNCESVAYEGRVQAFIEIAKGKPRTRVTQPERFQARERVPGTAVWYDRLKDNLLKTFPADARRGQVEADVVADVEFAPDTGIATKVTPVMVDLLDGVEAPGLVEQFKEAAVQALSAARYSDAPLPGDRPRKRCMVLNYRLSN